MALDISVDWDRSQLAAVEKGPLKGAAKRALRKAGATALRDMRGEISKRVRARKRIKARFITRALTLRRAKGGNIANMEWAVDVSGEPVPLSAYPHRQTKKGVSVEVNKGKRTLIASAFKASLKSGHAGVFKRKGKARLPIEELRGSRPVDALMHKGEAEAVLARGQKSFQDTFNRVLPLELAKAGAK